MRVIRFLKRIFFALVFFAVGVGLCAIFLPAAKAPVEIVKAVFNPAEAAFGKKGSLYVLLCGLDYSYDSKAQRHTKDARTDTIMLVRVDPTARELSMLSIPRDLLVPIAGTGGSYDKINSAYSYGGIGRTKKTVESYLGVSIDHYVVVKSDVVEAMVNALGGVPITVEKQMDYDDNWANLHIHLKPGEQVLNGKQAVGFLRFRHDEEGDFGRIRRQQQFLTALIRELKKGENWTKYPDLATTVSKQMKTDLRPEQLVGLGKLYRDFPLADMHKGRLEVADYFEEGISYLVPVEGEPKSTMRALFPPLPDPSLRKISVVIDDYRSGDRPRLEIVKRFKNAGFGPITMRQPGREGKTIEETKLVVHGDSPAAEKALDGLFPGVFIYTKKSEESESMVVLKLKATEDIR